MQVRDYLVVATENIPIGGLPEFIEKCLKQWEASPEHKTHKAHNMEVLQVPVVHGGGASVHTSSIQATFLLWCDKRLS